MNELVRAYKHHSSVFNYKDEWIETTSLYLAVERHQLGVNEVNLLNNGVLAATGHKKLLLHVSVLGH